MKSIQYASTKSINGEGFKKPEKSVYVICVWSLLCKLFSLLILAAAATASDDGDESRKRE